MNDFFVYRLVVVKGFLIVKFFLFGFYYLKIMFLKKIYICIELDYWVL